MDDDRAISPNMVNYVERGKGREEKEQANKRASKHWILISPVPYYIILHYLYITVHEWYITAWFLVPEDILRNLMLHLNEQIDDTNQSCPVPSFHFTVTIKQTAIHTEALSMTESQLHCLAPAGWVKLFRVPFGGLFYY